MNKALKIVFSLVIALIWIPSLYAQEKEVKYNARVIYNYFSSFTPQHIMDYTRNAAVYFKTATQHAMELPKPREEKILGKALRDYLELTSNREFKTAPFHPFLIIVRCDLWRVVAHPLKRFTQVMRREGFLKKYRDIKGNKIALRLCEEIKRKKNGVWGIQFQWWPATPKPLWMGIFEYRIPGTPYQLQSFYPTIKYNEEELNSLVK